MKLDMGSIDASVINQLSSNNIPNYQQYVRKLPNQVYIRNVARKTSDQGLGAGVLGAGAGLAMATMGSDGEKKELMSKEKQKRETEFDLLTISQVRDRSLSQMETGVRQCFIKSITD